MLKRINASTMIIQYRLIYVITSQSITDINMIINILKILLELRISNLLIRKTQPQINPPNRANTNSN